MRQAPANNVHLGTDALAQLAVLKFARLELTVRLRAPFALVRKLFECYQLKNLYYTFLSFYDSRVAKNEMQ